MPLSLLCICARLIGPSRVIFILFAVSVDDMAKSSDNEENQGACKRWPCHK